MVSWSVMATASSPMACAVVTSDSKDIKPSIEAMVWQ